MIKEIMRCKNCQEKEGVKYGKYCSGDFCSKECSKSFSTKNKRKEISDKVRKKLKGSGNPDVTLKCKTCGVKFDVEWKRRKKRKYCSKECSYNKEIKEETRKKLSQSSKKRCCTLEGRNRMREIGRKGGFGKKGYTDKGVYYESNLEKKCFELLESKGIKFEPHKNLPNSSKVSDIYFPDWNEWVELDGIDREKRKKWLKKQYVYWKNKIEIYEENNLSYCILKSFREFENWLKNKS